MKSMKQCKLEQAANLARLVEYAGNQTRLAQHLGVTVQAVNGWIARGRISATCAREAEKLTNGLITKEELRPDVTVWLSE